jgi:hypothetical protein
MYAGGIAIRNMARFIFAAFRKEATMRILLTCLWLACAATVFMISHAEKRQEAALESLSNYKRKPQPQPVLYDDPGLKLITARSPYMRNER